MLALLELLVTNSKLIGILHLLCIFTNLFDLFLQHPCLIIDCDNLNPCEDQPVDNSLETVELFLHVL